MTMPEKRQSPLNNPPLEKRADDGYFHCPYCHWLTKSTGYFNTHISKYHEEVVVAEGKRVREKGGIDQKLDEAARWGNGGIQCYWNGVEMTDLTRPLDELLEEAQVMGKEGGTQKE